MLSDSYMVKKVSDRFAPVDQRTILLLYRSWPWGYIPEQIYSIV